MGRPKANNVDYFPCYCKDGKVLFVLESRWGNAGYAFFYKLWKRIGDADFHYIDLRPLDNWEYFRAKMGVSDTETTDILNKLAEMGVIDPELWSQKIIWSDSFVESVKGVWEKRKQAVPEKPLFLLQKSTLLEQKQQMDGVSVPEGTQSKVKKSKVKYIKPLSSDSDEIRLSEMLFSLIQQRDVNVKKPNMQTWGRQIDLLMRVDNRGSPEIEKVIKWCQGDPFWQNNILSTKKLREKFTQLLLKMNGGNGNGNGRNYQPSAAAPVAKTGSARSDGQPYPVDLEA